MNPYKREEMAEFPFEEDKLEVTEKRVIRRLRVKNLVDSLLQAFNLERGGIYTVKELFNNPGEMVARYISTGRLHFTAPFKLLLITTTLAFFFLRYSEAFNQFTEGFFMGLQDDDKIDFVNDMSKYFNIILWIYIPIGALFTWLFNRKTGYNYAENLAYQTYFFCLTNMIMMLTLLDFIVYPELIIIAIYIGFIFYNLYSYKVFFKKGWLRAFLESTVIYVLSSSVYMLIVIGASAVYIKFFVK